MKYAIFNNTPAHVHLYKKLCDKLLSEGNEVLIFARDFGCTIELLDYYNLPYTVYGSRKDSMASLFSNLPIHYSKIAKEMMEYGPDMIFGIGTGSYSAIGKLICNVPVVTVMDGGTHMTDDNYLLKTQQKIFPPFLDIMLSPHTIKKKISDKHYFFNGFKESAYLHPDNYIQDINPYKKMGLNEDEDYSLVRFNSFSSNHDIGEKGFSVNQKMSLINTLANYGDVYISNESMETPDQIKKIDGVRMYDFHPAYLHDIINCANVVVSDGQTVITEAAMLGTPAIRHNSFVEKSGMGNFIELAKKSLIYNLSNPYEVIEKAELILDSDNIIKRHSTNYRDYMENVVDPTLILYQIAHDPSNIEDTVNKDDRIKTHPNQK